MPGRRGTRKPSRTNIYRRRRVFAVSVVLLSILVLVFAAFAQDSEVSDRGLPIDPNNATPDVVLTEAAGVYISSPIRPENLTGLGYHPEGESLAQMSPRGRNLSGNSIFRLFATDSTPEKIQYYLMDPAGRPGPRTGALDVGAEAGTSVYAPVTGTVVAIRPDPILQEGGKVVEITPADNPNIRVNVSFVQDVNGELGPKSPVTAGITELGKVADSRKVLSPQLASYTAGTGNHVTISVPKIN
ncbi:MAG: hypothetical protein JOZ19_11150 [Rubrobacter sp.]|nr:hypothetical protein [Rubrobacter sp.]